jgi:hypothetical protein
MNKGEGRAMKEIGIITLISVAAIAAAPAPRPIAAAPLQTFKSAPEFADCVAKSQDRRKAAWWFVPSSHGGVFSNLGAATDRKAYFVVIKDRGARREIALRDGEADSPITKAVSQCI